MGVWMSLVFRPWRPQHLMTKMNKQRILFAALLEDFFVQTVHSGRDPGLTEWPKHWMASDTMIWSLLEYAGMREKRTVEISKKLWYSEISNATLKDIQSTASKSDGKHVRDLWLTGVTHDCWVAGFFSQPVLGHWVIRHWAEKSPVAAWFHACFCPLWRVGFTASKLYKDYRRPECLRWHSVGNLRQMPGQAAKRERGTKSTSRLSAAWKVQDTLLKFSICTESLYPDASWCFMMLHDASWCCQLQVSSRAIFCAFAPGGDQFSFWFQHVLQLWFISALDIFFSWWFSLGVFSFGPQDRWWLLLILASGLQSRSTVGGAKTTFLSVSFRSFRWFLVECWVPRCSKFQDVSRCFSLHELR